MKIILYILLCCVPGILGAQHRSVNCIKNPQWNQIIQQAREEKKMIFVDCGASWCMPCKQFASEVLTKDSVADFFNEQFINVYMDIDKDTLPDVGFKPHIAAIPSILFIDAEKMEVVHAKIGGLTLSNILHIARTALGENIAARRKLLQTNQLPKEKMLAFLTDLSAGGYRTEYFNYLPQYLDTLSPKSLSEKANWLLCKKELKDITQPLFQKIWNHRQLLIDLYGEEEVMQWFNQTTYTQLFHELDWRTRREQFDEASFQKMYSWIAASELPDKEEYLLSMDTERLARDGNFQEVFKQLQKVWQKDWPEEKKRDFIIPFITKIYLNSSKKEQKTCIQFADSLANQATDLGVKAYFLRLESEIWQYQGNTKMAHKLDSLATICINPNYYKR